MKNENYGLIMIAFAGWRAKWYSYEIDNNETLIECERVKGGENCVVKNEIKFQNHVECLQKGNKITCKQKLYKTVKHIVFTINKKK